MHVTAANSIWPDPDRAVAKAHAQALAGLLRSKAVSQRRGVIGEPLCLYAVPLHDAEFWFTVRVSDRACVVDARHRRQSAIPVTFAVALGQPAYANTEHAAERSGALGVDVFVPPEPEWRDRAGLLLHPLLRPVLAEVDWTIVRRAALHNVQLDALIDLQHQERVAEQVLVLRRLLLTAFPLASGAG